MKTLSASIKLLEASGDYTNTVVTTGGKISNMVSNIPLNTKVSGGSPFILGATPLGVGRLVNEPITYYIGAIVSNSDGVFSTPYEIQLLGNNITSFSILFDDYNNQYPHSIEIKCYSGGVEVETRTLVDNDPIYYVTDIPNASRVTITISNWSVPHYPLRIQGIYSNTTIEIDYTNMISLETSIFDRSDTKLPSYGIISNVGNIEANDTNGEVLDYAEMLLLQDGLDTTIKLHDTLSKVSQTVGVLKTGVWDYNNENRSYSVSLKDDLEEWQDIYIEGLGYDPRNPTKHFSNMAQLYIILQGKTPSKYKMLTFDKLDSETKRILNATFVKYSLLNGGTLWEQWTKLCQVCALYIHKDMNGNTVCRHTLGS